MSEFLVFLLLVGAGWWLPSGTAQQAADLAYRPSIEQPAYPSSRGPVVLVDEAHHNFHTATGRYQPFAELLRRDGYVVQSSRERFTRQTLSAGALLVVANALAERNQSAANWSLPTPSAFTDAEIKVVTEWVRDGGSLWLIADHMPFPGAADKLAAAFGVRFSNGFAFEQRTGGGPLIFRRSDGSLKDHSIIRGRNENEKVEAVATFTGSAFQIDGRAQPLLVFTSAVESLEPKVAWEFDANTKKLSVKGWCQGAVLRYGKGRVAVFGEAAMFTAQLAGPQRTPMGINAPSASQNYQLLLNVAHWLSGLLAA